MLSAMWQSQRDAEYFLREARTKVSQSDINQSLIMAIDQLARAVKRLQDEIHRVRATARRRFA